MSKMCEPIAALVQSLHHLGFTTIEQKVSDYHFSELYIKMKGKQSNEIDTINIPQIQRITTLLLRVRAIGLPSNYAMKRKKQERMQNKTEQNRKHKPIKGYETSI